MKKVNYDDLAPRPAPGYQRPPPGDSTPTMKKVNNDDLAPRPAPGYQRPPPGRSTPTMKKVNNDDLAPRPAPGYQRPPPGRLTQIVLCCDCISTKKTAVVVTHPGYAAGPLPGGTCRYGDYPCLIVCQFCTATVATNISHTVGTLPWLICALLCVMCCWLGCCLTPFCEKGFHDVIHTCPNCRAIVGRFNRL